jgi:hypothetical protein
MAVARKQLISTEELVELLIAAGVTDAARWPVGLEQGAQYLQQIRAIEKHCVQNHGRWDIDLLDEAAEEEYEDACALLDRLRRELDPQPNMRFPASH